MPFQSLYRTCDWPSASSASAASRRRSILVAAAHLNSCQWGCPSRRRDCRRCQTYLHALVVQQKGWLGGRVQQSAKSLWRTGLWPDHDHVLSQLDPRVDLVLNAQGYSYQAGLWLDLVVAPEGGRVQQSAKSLWRAGLWLAPASAQASSLLPRIFPALFSS